MSYDPALAPGTAIADIPGIFDPDDPTCDCAHTQSEHGDSWSHCEHVEDEERCPCQGFEPSGAY